MTDERTIYRIIAHLRTHVTDLRRLEREGASPDELAQRRRLISQLQNHLAYAVRDLVSIQRPSPV
jgi:hypothetical protein